MKEGKNKILRLILIIAISALLLIVGFYIKPEFRLLYFIALIVIIVSLKIFIKAPDSEESIKKQHEQMRIDDQKEKAARRILSLDRNSDEYKKLANEIWPTNATKNNEPVEHSQTSERTEIENEERRKKQDALISYKKMLKMNIQTCAKAENDLKTGITEEEIAALYKQGQITIEKRDELLNCIESLQYMIALSPGLNDSFEKKIKDIENELLYME